MFNWESVIGKKSHYTDIPFDFQKDIKTKRQWAKEGLVALDEECGVRLYSNWFHNGTYLYLHRSEVRTASEEELDSIFADEKKKRNEAAKRRYRERREKEKRKAFWDKCREVSERREVFDIKTSPVIVIDTETTGLHPIEDELLQVSIIDATDGSTLFDSYLKPQFHDSWVGAEQINGITPQMVENAPDLISVLPKLNYIMRAAQEVVAYNGDFDVSFLKTVCVDFSSVQTYKDVMEDFAVIYGDWNAEYQSFTWKSLSVCASYFGYEWGSDGAHNSLEDCKATLFCYNKICNPKNQAVYDKNMRRAYDGVEE